MPQQAFVQALAHLPVGIAQPKQGLPAEVLFIGDGKVAGLKQQGLGADVVHVEGRKQIPGAGHVVQGEGTDLAVEQRFHQERGRAGLEPPGIEFTSVEEQEDVEWVVHLLLAPPTVAVVPVADLVPVEPRELRREHGVQVRVRVAADGGVARVQGDVLEIVQAGEQAHFGRICSRR